MNSWCTYLNAEQIAEALVWTRYCEYPTIQAHSLLCVLQGDLLSREGRAA